MGLGPLHLGVTRGEVPLAHRRDNLEGRVKRTDGGLEAHLVVALASAAVGDVLGAILVRDVHEVLGDDGARKRGEQRVDALVLAVCPDGLGDDCLGVLLAHVDGLGGDGAHVEGLLLDPREVLLVLAYVAADGDDVHVLLDLQPLHDDGRVQTTGIREDDLFLLSHVGAPFCCWALIPLADMRTNERRGCFATSRRAPDRAGRCWVPCLELSVTSRTTRTYASARDIAGLIRRFWRRRETMPWLRAVQIMRWSPLQKVARDISRGCRCYARL